MISRRRVKGGKEEAQVAGIWESSEFALFGTGVEDAEMERSVASCMAMRGIGDIDIELQG